MKKYLFLSLTLLLAVMASCKYASQVSDAVTGTKMDSEAAYTKTVELLAGIDPAWKVYRVRVSAEGLSDECKNTLGSIIVGFVNKDGEVYSQLLYPTKAQPDIDNFAPKGMEFAELPTLDFTAEKAMKIIGDCKAQIPEGYKFLSLYSYEMEYDSKLKGFVTDVTINVQEIGKENIDVNGTTSGVYYQLRFKITPDGKIEMRES